MNRFTARVLLRLFHFMVQDYQSKNLFNRDENFGEMVDEIEDMIINHKAGSDISNL